MSAASWRIQPEGVEAPTMDLWGRKSGAVRESRLYCHTTCILITLSLLVPALAAADGMAFVYRPTSSLEPLAVNEQRAVIAHKDGMQRMFIAINLENPPSAKDPSRSAVWIFPVPGTPDRADVDVTAFFPELTGHDVKSQFDDLMQVARWAPMGTQPHFLLLALISRAAGVAGWQGAPGVTTHKEVDRWGIHAELISADSVDRLADYLRKKNVEVAEELLQPFTPYLSDKYVLVVGWISSYEEVIRSFPEHKSKEGAKWPSLYVEFPTEKAFFPMRPTSAYGKNKIDVTLYFVGSLTPDMSSWTPAEKQAMHPYIKYCAGEKAFLDRAYRDFLITQSKGLKETADKGAATGQREAVKKFMTALPEGPLPFTRVHISAPAENFTQDLWFVPSPLGSIMHFVVSSPWILAPGAIFLLLCLSYVSGGISGRLVFREWKPWARTGLWNCFTIIGLVIAAWLKRKDPNPEKAGAVTSGRREALLFGAFMAMPILGCLAIYIPIVTDIGLGWHQVLLAALSAVGLLMGGWVASTAVGARPMPTVLRSGSHIVGGIEETFLRVFAWCAPATLLWVAILSQVTVVQGHGTRTPLFPSLPMYALTSVGLAVVVPGLIVLGLLAASWIARKVGVARPAGRNCDHHTAEAALPGGKPVILTFGVLTCIPATLLVLSFPFHEAARFSFSALEVGWFGFITVELLMATWVVWAGHPGTISVKPRFSPAWPCAIAALLPLIGFITVIAAYMLPGDVARDSSHHVIVLPVGRPAVTVVGLIVIIGLLNRSRIERVAHEMTYKSALSVMLCVLSALSYLAVPAYLVLILTGILSVGGAIAALALLLGTWLVWRALNEGPTKTLRFGAIFSVVFSILTVGTAVLLGKLIALLGA